MGAVNTSLTVPVHSLHRVALQQTGREEEDRMPLHHWKHGPVSPHYQIRHLLKSEQPVNSAPYKCSVNDLNAESQSICNLLFVITRHDFERLKTTDIITKHHPFSELHINSAAYNNNPKLLCEAGHGGD